MGKLIGVSGYARTGKDTIGQILVDEHGFFRIAFADAVREGVYALNPWVPIEVAKPLIDPKDSPLLFEERKKPRYEMRLRRVQEIVDEYGWEKAKAAPEIRRLLQAYGTEAGREIHGHNAWVDVALRKWKEAGYCDTVITDCRFPNEAAAIREAGGEVWRVNRPGVGPQSNHPSEISVDEFEADHVIYNDSTIEDLAAKLRGRFALKHS